MYTSILVPVDGSEESEKAFCSACDLCSKYSASLHLVHVSNYWQFMAGIGEAVAMIPLEEFEAPGKELLRKTLETAIGTGCKSAKSYFLSGEPGKAIVDKAKEVSADLIVIGSRGHSDLSGLLLGSVSHKVCNSAECSCLVVR